MMQWVRVLVVVLLCWCGAAQPLRAQYFDWGRSPSSLRWRQIEGPSGHIIYPDYYETQARTIARYQDSLLPYITYGYSHQPIRIPTVLHTQNFQANGLVLWAPRRIELELIPDVSPFAEPWAKQLMAHEYRHAVQYGNLYQGFMKPLGWFIGEQSGLISSVLAPIWFLEGDAVQMETEMSAYGRGLQPSFTIAYRAYLTEGTQHFRMDKWFCGSYVDYIPSHYHIGYQMATWSRETYGDELWDKVIDYSSKHPYTLATTYFALQKYHKTSTHDMFNSMMAELQAYWKSLPLEPNSGEIIPTPITSFTTYENPLPLNDSTLVVVKTDLDRFTRVVRVNTRTAKEKSLFHVGLMSTPMTMRDSILYWTEFRNSVLWEQRVNSRACSYDLHTEQKRTLRDRDNALYPTPLPGGVLATVGYRYTGSYFLELNDGVTFDFPDSISIHGLAYDDRTQTLAFLALSNGGMSLNRIDPHSGAITPITQPSYVSLYHLQGGAGKLTYNSIYSGKDEIHLYDLEAAREYRLTTSRYGSLSPSPADSTNLLYFTTFGLKGYQLARQQIEPDSLHALEYIRLPYNTINPPRRKWNTLKISTLSSLPADSTEAAARPSKPFRKGLNAINTHSWAPWFFNPFEIAQEDRVELGFGVTAMSQDLLSSTFGHLAYGRTTTGRNRFQGSLSYYGLAPKFEVTANYGGLDQLVYGVSESSPMPTSLNNHFQLNLRAYLPMKLTAGYRIRTLTPQAEFVYLNALLYRKDGQHFDHGYVRRAYSLKYFDQVRMATRDLQPRWGYGVRATSLATPFRNDFSSLYSLWALAYTPGLFPHHGFTLRGNLQTQSKNTYAFYYKDLFPRGANYNVAAYGYGAFSVDYLFPLCYPEWGLNSIIFIKRINLRTYYDASYFWATPITQTNTQSRSRVTSYGGELMFDLSLLRIPDKITRFGVYLYKPSDIKGVVMGLHFELPL